MPKNGWPLGLDVYVHKPLRHTLYEARRFTEATGEYKRVTQMGRGL